VKIFQLHRDEDSFCAWGLISPKVDLNLNFQVFPEIQTFSVKSLLLIFELKNFQCQTCRSIIGLPVGHKKDRVGLEFGAESASIA
jgi:hypothetical protein